MIKNLEKKFNKNGYVIAKTKEKELLLKLQSKILELILASNKSARQNFKRFKIPKIFSLTFINLYLWMN